MTTYAPSHHKALYARSRSTARTHATCANYARYEVEKAIWASAHPQATSGEYESAIRSIAKACGV